jgi:hypothetical protein
MLFNSKHCIQDTMNNLHFKKQRYSIIASKFNLVAAATDYYTVIANWKNILEKIMDFLLHKFVQLQRDIL